MSIFVLIDGVKNEIKTEKQFIELSEVIKNGGHYEDVAICPFCKEPHKITQYTELCVSFFTPDECFFSGVFFESRLVAIKKMKELSEILDKPKELKPLKQPFVESELKSEPEKTRPPKKIYVKPELKPRTEIKRYYGLSKEERKEKAIELIKKLSKNCTYKEIAQDFNSVGLLSMGNKEWNEKNLWAFVQRHKILPNKTKVRN